MSESSGDMTPTNPSERSINIDQELLFFLNDELVRLNQKVKENTNKMDQYHNVGAAIKTEMKAKELTEALAMHDETKLRSIAEKVIPQRLQETQEKRQQLEQILGTSFPDDEQYKFFDAQVQDGKKHIASIIEKAPDAANWANTALNNYRKQRNSTNRGANMLKYGEVRQAEKRYSNLLNKLKPQ